MARLVAVCSALPLTLVIQKVGARKEEARCSCEVETRGGSPKVNRLEEERKVSGFDAQ